MVHGNAVIGTGEECIQGVLNGADEIPALAGYGTGDIGQPQVACELVLVLGTHRPKGHRVGGLTRHMKRELFPGDDFDALVVAQVQDALIRSRLSVAN
jgi:hypothetical protein